MKKKLIALLLALMLAASSAALAEEPVAAPVDEAPAELEYALSPDSAPPMEAELPLEGDVNEAEAEPPRGTLALSAGALTLGVGESRGLTCTRDGQAADVVYSSSDAAVASVNSDGLVAGVAVGSATITATDAAGCAATCAVTVMKAPETLKLNAKSATLGYDADSGQGMTFQILPKLSAGSASAITYTGYSEKVIEVTAGGRIRPRGVGKTKVTARTYNGLAAKITVKVLPTPKEFSLDVQALAMLPKETHALQLVLPKNTVGCFGFQSDDTKVAKVNAVTGVVTAVGRGEATITATCFNGAFAACAVSVLPKPKRVQLAADKASIGIGEVFPLDAKPIAKDGGPAGGALQYATSNAKIASVSADGAVTGRKAGSATITVTGVGGVKATCAVKVVKAPTSIKLSAAKPKLLGPGKTTTLKVTLSSGSASAIAYSGYDSAVVEVSAAGKVTAVGPGLTTITASTFNGKKARCCVRVLAEGQPRAVNVAHRGGKGYWPENTLEAFRNTASTGAAAVELDARTTKDGVQVVHHDASFTASGKKKVIKSLTLEQLRGLKPSLCTLDEAIEVIAASGLKMNLELKDTADPKACVEAVRKHGMEGRTVYISFQSALLTEVRRLEPSARLGYIINQTPSGLAKTLSAMDADFVFQMDKYLTKDNLLSWQNQGYQVGVWTVNDAKAIAKWLDMGVDYITSDYPKLTTQAM